jgi:hypothetical protein
MAVVKREAKEKQLAEDEAKKLVPDTEAEEKQLSELAV